MMHFLQPIWLVAMMGIALPVIVHFWNNRRGKVLRIGSIALLEGASQRMSWSRRLTQWRLLLVRCLLMIALALLLAGPYSIPRDSGRRGWVLVDTGAAGVDAAGGAAGGYGRTIDSLVKMGWRRHMITGDDYWAAFRAADKMAPRGVAFYVFTSGLASRFAGTRPATDRVVHWEVYAPKDSVLQWTEKAWSISRDSVRVMTGVARLTGSSYAYRTVGATRADTDSAATQAADTTTLCITIYTDVAYRQDGNYLAAAARAVQQYTHRRMQLTVTAGMPAGPVRGWLFWLSSRPLPAQVAAGTDATWQYAEAPEKKVDTWMEGTALYKEITRQSNEQEAIWKDGYGRGVLVRTGQRFQFYSRLNPEWGELVWSRQFPALLARLLFKEEGPGKHDLRILDAAQVAPVKGQDATRRDASVGEELKLAGQKEPHPEEGASDRVDLTPACWIILFLLFILERGLSLYSKNG